MMFARHLAIQFRTVGRYTVRSGRWWIPVMVLVWSLAALLIITAKAVVPYAVYTLF